VLAAIATYGVIHERLFAQPLWTATGQIRFLIFSAAYWAVAGPLLLLAPRWLGPSAAAFAFGYAIWWSGLAAPLATLYFFGSCFCLGKILRRDAAATTAILLGLAAWIFAVWLALPFPVNPRAVYLIAFAIPVVVYTTKWGRLPTCGRLPTGDFGFAALLYFLLAYFLIALKPETSADGLSMHLALPMAVAHDHRWAFDFRQYTWALMPAGGDCVFTAAYLLGGETAARLTNFGLLVLITAMLYQATRRSIAAALFVSTPLALLVTGSLFVENVWAALILGAVLAVVRYSDNARPGELRTAGALFGAAIAVKVIAVIYLAPAAVFTAWSAFQRRQLAPIASAAVLLAALAAPPYTYAWIKSGNPLFPFANTLFKSPYFSATEPFTDPRFSAPLNWRSGYDVTFQSERYFEGQAGAAGFQYFVLLIPAAILIRRRAEFIPFAIASTATVLLFAVLPNLRYMYPALILFSIVLWGQPFQAAAGLLPGVVIAIIALNAWFLPSSDWYQKDFAIFNKSQLHTFIESAAPERVLIGHLNRTAPREPVAFFSSDAIAGLEAKAYTDSWHTNDYWTQLRSARTAAEVAGILQRLGIRHIVAPVSLESSLPLIETFLRQWAEPSGLRATRMGLFSLRNTPVSNPRDTAPFPPGAYDDQDSRIEYNGAWIHDHQFAAASHGSITYCDVPGAFVRLKFVGSAITYVFTKALNRGTGQVLIDGVERARIDMYSAKTEWRAERSFNELVPGQHVFEVRVLNEKNPDSSGTYVDLDAIIVRP